MIGYGWLREHDRRVREAVAAARSLDSLRLAVTDVRKEADARHLADSLAAWQSIQARDVALRRARREADSLTGLAGTLVDSLENVVPDSLSPFVARLRGAWHAELAGREAERALADSALAARDIRLRQIESAYDHDMAAVRVQLAEAMRQLGEANRRASPTLWRRVVTVLPWMAGVYLAARATQ
jgi:hypothetical protein